MNTVLVDLGINPKELTADKSSNTNSELDNHEQESYPPVLPAGKPKKINKKVNKINEQLKALGVEPDKRKGNCARAAIYRGHILLTDHPSDLDQVVVKGKLDCGDLVEVTLRDLLKQPDYGGSDYADLEYATVECKKCTGGYRTYVSRICSGEAYFNNGKSHNHCTDCTVFGECIDDYERFHCGCCGEHYFGYESDECQCQDSDDDVMVKLVKDSRKRDNCYE